MVIVLILWRPRKIPEAVWACAGGAILVITRILPLANAGRAVWRGRDVYFFLAGMMLLAELARREGFFDWIAARAVRHARGSASRLFGLVYLTGTAVTVLLSNDATAVVLTPAVFAAARAAKAPPLPLLLICAFIANAASFVLPISNPANLVVYGSHLPSLAIWLRTFAVASVVSIAATYFVLRWLCREELRAPIESNAPLSDLSAAGRLAAWGIGGAALVLLAASALNWDLGLPTLAAALVCAVVVSLKDRGALVGSAKEISWTVLLLVAGLFVVLEAVNRAGAGEAGRSALKWLSAQSAWWGSMAAAFGVAVFSNVVNNLPAGLLVSNTVQTSAPPSWIRDALLIGVDVGPNLSVTGSLATILWLSALRRDGQEVTFGQFLRYGVVLMPAAMLPAVAAMVIGSSR